jgi:hypothetical protein
MVKVGDRIRLSSGKGPNREGVVTAVTGSMVRVRWPSGEETTVVPAPGTLTVLASSGEQASAVRREGLARQRTTAKKAATQKAATKKAATQKAATKKAATKKAARKKGATKKAATKKGATKKAATRTGTAKKTAAETATSATDAVGDHGV